MASPVVLPLCVGPTTVTDWDRSAASTSRPQRSPRPAIPPRTSRPGSRPRTTSEPTSFCRAQRAPWRSVEDVRDLPTRPATEATDAAATPTAATPIPMVARDRDDDTGRPAAQRAAIAASVSTRRRSIGLNKCWTRNARCPTFHSATPRRSWGSSSASVGESDSSSLAAATSPAGCA